MFDCQQFCCVVNRAIAVAVVADGAIQLMIT